MNNFVLTRERNFALGEIGRCGIQVFGPRGWDDAEHREFVEMLVQRARINYCPIVIAFFAAARLTNAQNRATMQRMSLEFPGRSSKIIVLTSSQTVRVAVGALTAIQRMVGLSYPLSVFKPSDLALALRSVEPAMSANEIAKIGTLIRSLAEVVGHRKEVVDSIAFPSV